MSTPPTEPSEDELRAAYEAELNRITSAEMIMQAAVSLLNIGARRMGLTGADEQPSQPDLEQVRDAIDGVRGLMSVLERRLPQESRPLREALSQLQMAYAREAQDSAAPTDQDTARPTEQNTPPAAAAKPTSPPQTPPKPGDDRNAGPAESSGRLWVPGR
ncbi:MAG TPA: hypothetical protein VID48_00195 [Solirubrobacteraceae bacterium]